MGKASQASTLDSPSTPRCWPSKIRAAVTVEKPMPSPTIRMTFLARLVLLLLLRMRCSAACACLK